MSTNLLTTSRGGGISRAPAFPFGEIRESEDQGFASRVHGFETRSSQTNDFEIDTFCFPAWRSALLGQDKDNVTASDSGHGGGILLCQ